MTTDFTYALAFATGLLGAFHCLGMCGGLAAGYFAGQGGRRWLFPQLGYHATRILVYVLLGGVGAAIGRVLAQTGGMGKFQGILMILAGLAIMLIGLGLTGLLPGWRRRTCPGQAHHGQVVRFEERPQMSRFGPLVAGASNGLVPCSLVFSVAIKAVASGTPIEAGLLMLSFGLGTLPTMVLVTTLGGTLSARVKGRMESMAGLLVVLLGAWTLYEGIVFYDIMRGLAG